jgi:uncharacterized membrane protein
MSNIFLGMNLATFLVLIFLIAVGIYDLYLALKGKKTITQYIRTDINLKWEAVGIFCLIMALIWWLLGPNCFIQVLIGGLLGHFFLWE